GGLERNRSAGLEDGEILVASRAYADVDGAGHFMDEHRWRQIEELYHDALGRAPEARRAFIEGACRGDRDLQSELESLLAHAEESGEFLETPALATSAELTPGDSLGPYQILALLGAGGMGKVYRARDARLGRTVAVKILNEPSSRL